jgi:hypothetical protein
MVVDDSGIGYQDEMRWMQVRAENQIDLKLDWSVVCLESASCFVGKWISQIKSNQD